MSSLLRLPTVTDRYAESLTDLLNRYGDIATYLGLDLVAIFLMTYVLYFEVPPLSRSSGYL